jgi:hypothetical protein
MPSDFRCERRAKWSYFSRAKRVRLKTTDEVNAPLVGAAVLQQALKFWAVRGFRALAFLFEALEDFVALAMAIVLART